MPQGTLITPPANNEYDTDAFDQLHATEEELEAAARIEADGLERESEEDVDINQFASEREQFERMFRREDPMP